MLNHTTVQSEKVPVLFPDEFVRDTLQSHRCGSSLWKIINGTYPDQPVHGSLPRACAICIRGHEGTLQSDPHMP